MQSSIIEERTVELANYIIETKCNVREAAKKFGISQDRVVTFENDSQGVQLNYHVVGKTLATMRACAPSERVGDEWKQEIREDYEKRGKLKSWKK